MRTKSVASEADDFSRGRHLIVLSILIFIGLVRGLFWTLITPVWYVLDEAHHYAYIENLATGRGLPIVGKDKVSEEVLQVAKNSPTSPARSTPIRPSTDDPRWGVFREQYEGIQSPLYYVLLSPVYVVWRPAGVLAAIYALRVSTVVVALAAVPLVWQLARSLFPDRPSAWLGSSAVLVTAQGFNSNLAALTNDALLVPMSILVYLSLLWAARRGFRMGPAAITGLLLGCALLTKMTAIPLVVIAGIGTLILPASQKTGVSRRVKFGLVMGVAALATIAPWLIRNRQLYGSFTSTNTIGLTTASLQPRIPLNLSGLKTHAVSAVGGFWQSQGFNIGDGKTYGLVFGGVAVASLIFGIATSLLRRNWNELRVIGWLGVSFPLAFITMLIVVYVFFDGLGTASGRHLYVALPTLVLLLVAGFLTSLRIRFGITVLLVLLALVLALESRTFVGYADVWYTPGIIKGDLTPVVDQSYNDGFIEAQEILAMAPCRVEVLGLGLDGPASPAVIVSGHPAATLLGTDGVFSLYSLDVPVGSRFSIDVGGIQVGRSFRERASSLAFSDAQGDPMARLYCRRSDAKNIRFQEMYGPQHPKILTYAGVVLWSSLWIGVSGILVAMVLIRAALWFARRSDQPSDGAPIGGGERVERTRD